MVGQPGGKQAPGRTRHHGGVLRGLAECALPGIGLEIGAANLDRDTAGREALRPQARGGSVGERRQMPIELAGVTNVLHKGFLGTDRFLLAIGDDRTLVASARQRPHRSAVLAEGAPQRLLARTSRISDGTNAGCLHRGQGFLSDSKQPLNGQCIEHVVQILRPDAEHAVGLCEVRGDLGQQLIGCDPDRGTKFSGGANPAADPCPDRVGIPEQPQASGDVQKRLVER